MLRSLLIGFLILSALTSKGAGAQILKEDLNISADMLLEFFNSVSVQSSKAAELSAIITDRSSFVYTSFNINQLKPPVTRLRQSGPITMPGQYDQTEHFPEDGMVFHKIVLPASQQVFYCASGLSPPAGEA